jgi:hypothetical protein
MVKIPVRNIPVKKEEPSQEATVSCRQKGFSMDTCSDRFLNGHRKLILFIKNSLYDELANIPQPRCMHDFIVEILEDKCSPRRREKVEYYINAFDQGSIPDTRSVNRKLNSL